MKRLLLTLPLLFPTALSSQELHTFSNGEVADAEKINENFEYLLTNAVGGCSAEQDGSNVVITCADGSSGVLASEGTVVLYPFGEAFPAEPITYNNGDIVLVDNNEILIAKVARTGLDGTNFYHYAISLTINGWDLEPLVFNDATTETVRILTESGAPLTGTKVLFMEPDCSGAAVWLAPAYNRTRNLIANTGDGNFFVGDEGAVAETLVFQSQIVSSNMAYYGELRAASECIPGELVAEAYRGVRYEPPAELINAIFPVKLEQLP